MTEYRRHTKSRNGCTYCKQKKIKCDEAYPCCFHCRRRNITCSLASRPLETRSTVVGHGQVLATAPPSVPTVGFQLNNPTDQAHLVWQDNLVRLRDVLAPSENANASSSGPTTSESLNERDVELMHHYCTVTVDTIYTRLDMRHVWRVVIPQIGYTHRFVMHGLLAIAATHKATLIPSQIHTYATISEHHQILGSEGFRSVVAHTNVDNWRPVFSFAMIVVLHLMALPSRSKNQKLETPVRSFVDLMCSVRGINACSAPFQNLIPGSELEPIIIGNQVLVGSGDLPSGIPPLDHSVLSANTFQALRLLRVFMATSSASKPGAKHYLDAVDALEMLTKRIALMSVAAEPTPLMSWSWLIDNSIIRDMENMQPLALLLVAYFAGIFVSFEPFSWLVRGWSKSLVNEITNHLSAFPAYAELMFWPTEQVANAWG